MGGIFTTRTAIAVVTEALAAGVAVAVEPWRSGHDITVFGTTELTTSLAQARGRQWDTEWAEDGREGDVWERDEVRHVDYPHEPGYLYDCPLCESRCHCDTDAVRAGREVPCVYCGALAEALGY